MDHRSIVLTGFMGTGKTSTGNALAQLLQRSFVDMDIWIQEREGMSIADLFAQKGIEYFRAVERDLCVELASGNDLVIATGGGALLDPINRAAFANAHVICLDASPDEILLRLEGMDDRPLLQGDRRTQLQSLYDARRAIYAQIPLHIQTDGRTPEQVAHEILQHLEPRKIHVPTALDGVTTPESSYSILLGRGLLDRVGELCAHQSLAARCAVVTNPTVGALYTARVVASLRHAGFDPAVIEIPDGEPYKNLDTISTLYDQFVAAKLERRSPIFALGGGVIGDTTGFAAASYLRGVPFIQIPTTLLSMVDSSIGGKVGVDHPSGKNLIGAFKFPLHVIADMDALDSLPIEEYRAGMAEVIKHGVIGDAHLFNALKTRPLDDELLAQALQVKVEVVTRDPYEQNIRAHLNLGHTFGQAVERLAHYQMRHGYAVAMGLAAAARLAANLEWCAPTVRDDILALLAQHDLPIQLPREFTADQILNAMGTDKKIQNQKLRLILPRELGKVDIATDVPSAEILQAINDSF